jgi:hypothetical protein
VQDLIVDPEMAVVIRDICCSVCNKVLRQKALFTDKGLELSSHFVILKSGHFVIPFSILHQTPQLPIYRFMSIYVNKASKGLSFPYTVPQIIPKRQITTDAHM